MTMHITTTLDPVSLNDAARNPTMHLRGGEVDIYLESEENLRTYQGMDVGRTGVDFIHNLDNPTEECGTDWN